ncbi:MAG: hypothetical protein HOE90_10055 [Bacteriovoracaceae bacterium]|jgi:hypothetical protein|nr:hypothetical protein [Bacteriovoracaceae bacterium]
MKKLTLFLFLVAITENVYAKLEIVIDSEIEGHDYALCKYPKAIFSPKEKEKIKFRILGADEDDTFVVTYSNNGYNDISLEKYKTFETKKDSFKISVHPVSDDLQFAVNTIIVVRKQKNGELAQTASKEFRVYKKLVFQKSKDTSLDCFQRFRTEKLTGLIHNSTSTERIVNVSEQVINSVYRSEGKSTSFFLRLSLMNLFDMGPTFNSMKSVARGTVKSVNRNLTTRIQPGETIILGKQQTLFKDYYEVYKPSLCGTLEHVGVGILNYYKTNYPAIAVDPMAENPFRSMSVGYDDTLNTCGVDEFAGEEVIFDLGEVEKEDQ